MEASGQPVSPVDEESKITWAEAGSDPHTDPRTDSWRRMGRSSIARRLLEFGSNQVSVAHLCGTIVCTYQQKREDLTFFCCNLC